MKIVAAAILLLAQASMPDAFEVVHDDYARQLADKFADVSPPDLLAGDDFKWAIQVHDGSQRGGPSGPFYTFEDGRLRLIFSLHENYADPGIRGPKFAVGDVGGARVRTRSFTGTNSFGAKAQVTSYRHHQNRLAFVSGPVGEVSPYMDAENREFYERQKLTMKRQTYWVEIPLPGPEARAVATDADLIIEGRIAHLHEGKTTYCEPFYAGASVSSPTEAYGSTCWFGADVSRVAFVRRGTGEVIREWQTEAATLALP